MPKRKTATATVDSVELTDDLPENTQANQTNLPKIEFTVDLEAIRSALATVNRFVPTKASHPILENIYVLAEPEKKRLVLKAFDMSLGCTICIDASVEKGGTFLVPGKTIWEIVNKLPQVGKITASVEAQSRENPDSPEALECNFTCDRKKYKLVTSIAAEFPELPTISNAAVIELTNSDLLEGIKRTSFAASTDLSKQVLNGVNLAVNSEYLEFQATDGHRMGLHVLPKKNGNVGNEGFSVIIPLKTLAEIERLLKKESHTVIISLNEGYANFQINPKLTVTSRLLEGDYPKVNQLVPDKFSNLVTLSRIALLEMLQRITVISQKDLVRLDIDSGNQSISLSAENSLGSGSEIESANIVGENLLIALNGKYAIESLSNLESPDVCISFNESTLPFVIAPVNSGKTKHLLMPIQIRGT